MNGNDRGLKRLMKKYIAVFLLGIILGGVIHNNRHYFTRPFKKLSTEEAKKFNILNFYNKSILISRYTRGSPLWIDRSYFDQIGDKRLEGLFLILTKRHRQDLVMINGINPLTVYRLVSESNNNNIFEGYEETDIRVLVVGASSVHTKVIKKTFPKGIISLAPGGPTSSSPILILVEGESLHDLGFRIINN